MRSGTRVVSISDICERANVSRPTFYRCFEDKAALVHSLYQDAVNRPIEEIILEQLPARGADKAWLRGSLDAVFDAIFAQHRMALWLYTESSDRTSMAYEIIDGTFEQAATLLESWLFPAGCAPPHARTVFKSVMAACQWIARDAMERELTPEARDNAKRAAWVLVEGVLDTVRPKAP